MILTAAHCIDFSTTGGMVLGDFYVEDAETAQGDMLKVAPVFVDPMSDIAALGALDDQAFPPEHCEPFMEFCDSTKPVKVSAAGFEPFRECPVNVYTHKGEWITGRARLSTAGSPMAWAKFDKPIEGGTSGSPIVNGLGELVGIVSNGTIDGSFACINMALPVWIMRIFEDIRNPRNARKRREDALLQAELQRWKA
jgi:S1-C subfamily serine protease